MYIEDYPLLGEDFMPGAAEGDEVYSSEQEVQASRPVVEYDATEKEEEIQTPEGPQEVQEFGVDPRQYQEASPQGN